MKKIKTNWRDEEALRRFQLISPLLDESLDNAGKIHKRKAIAERECISVRTLYRYEERYLEGGFDGLKPPERTGTSRKLPENFDEILAQAIQLKREVPQRSVIMIISILEMEGWAPPGRLKRSTMQRYLFNAGFSVRQMQMYNDARKSSSKRFCKPHRMMMVQADIKYGPKLPIGKNGKYKRTYLSSAIDDHSRLILYSKFYDHQEASVVEDTFRQTILRHGRFDMAYVDHGGQYVSAQLVRSLAMLDIKVRKAPVRSGKSKGVVEKFHQVVDAFMREYRLKKSRSDQTLERLNYFWKIFLEEHYQKHSHDGIREYYESLKVPVPEEGITPRQEFMRDRRPLVFLDRDVVAEAFRHHEDRKVDKGACISFNGKKYETKPALIGATVEISYDPASPETVTVHYPGMEPFDASPVKIGPFCDKNPALPVSMQAADPDTSRLLDALEKKHRESTRVMADALSFADYGKDGE